MKVYEGLAEFIRGVLHESLTEVLKLSQFLRKMAVLSIYYDTRYENSEVNDSGSNEGQLTSTS